MTARRTTSSLVLFLVIASSLAGPSSAVDAAFSFRVPAIPVKKGAAVWNKIRQRINLESFVLDTPKKDVVETTTVSVGSSLPDVNVKELTLKEEGSRSFWKKHDGQKVKIPELIGKGKCLLIGMPGGTTTCMDSHLVGYKTAIDQFQDLGIEKIAILSTKAHSIMEQVFLPDSDDETMIVIQDRRAALAKSMGLADNMGLRKGFLSKRFAMVVEDGVITHLELEDSVEECHRTSADQLLKALTPAPVVVEKKTFVSAAATPAVATPVVATPVVISPAVAALVEAAPSVEKAPQATGIDAQLNDLFKKIVETDPSEYVPKFTGFLSTDPSEAVSGFMAKNNMMKKKSTPKRRRPTFSPATARAESSPAFNLDAHLNRLFNDIVETDPSEYFPKMTLLDDAKKFVDERKPSEFISDFIAKNQQARAGSLAAFTTTCLLMFNTDATAQVATSADSVMTNEAMMQTAAHVVTTVAASNVNFEMLETYRSTLMYGGF